MADGVAEGDVKRVRQVRQPHPAPGVDVQIVHSGHEDKRQEEAVVPLRTAHRQVSLENTTHIEEKVQYGTLLLLAWTQDFWQLD